MKNFRFKGFIYIILLCFCILFSDFAFAGVRVKMKKSAVPLDPENIITITPKKIINEKRQAEKTLKNLKLNIINMEEQEEGLRIEAEDADKKKCTYIFSKKLGIEMLNFEKKDNAHGQILDDQSLMFIACKFILKNKLANVRELHLFRINELRRNSYDEKEENQQGGEVVDCKQFEFRRKLNGTLILAAGSVITVNITLQGDIESVFIDWPEIEKKPVFANVKRDVFDIDITSAVESFSYQANASSQYPEDQIIEVEVEDVIFAYAAKKIDMEQINSSAEIEREIKPGYILRCKIKTAAENKDIEKDLFFSLDTQQIE